MIERVHILLERAKACRGTQGLVFIDLQSIDPIVLAAEEYNCTVFYIDDCTHIGDIETDICEVLLTAGKAAKADKSAVLILVEHMETLPEHIIKALAMAFHKTQQKSLPVAFVATGNNTVRVSLANAAPYTERMFEFIETTGNH